MIGIVPSVAWYLVLLHLIVLYSLLVNQWLALPLALLTMFVANCLMGWVMLFPAMLMAAASGGGGVEVMAAVLMNGVYGLVAIGICFGLQMMIAQQLRVVASR